MLAGEDSSSLATFLHFLGAKLVHISSMADKTHQDVQEYGDPRENWNIIRRQTEWYASEKLSVSGYHSNLSRCHCFTLGPEITEDPEAVTGNSHPFSCRDEARVILENNILV